MMVCKVTQKHEAIKKHFSEHDHWCAMENNEVGCSTARMYEKRCGMIKNKCIPSKETTKKVFLICDVPEKWVSTLRKND